MQVLGSDLLQYCSGTCFSRSGGGFFLLPILNIQLSERGNIIQKIGENSERGGGESYKMGGGGEDKY